MNNEYFNKLEDQLEKQIFLLDQTILFCESKLSDEEIPLIDRTYFFYIYETSHIHWFTLQDQLDQVKALKERDTENRKKYLLTN